MSGKENHELRYEQIAAAQQRIASAGESGQEASLPNTGGAAGGDMGAIHETSPGHAARERSFSDNSAAELAPDFLKGEKS